MKFARTSAALALSLAAPIVLAQNVKITPLGTMEFDGKGKCVAGC